MMAIDGRLCYIAANDWRIMMSFDRRSFLDGSRIVVEALAQAGGDVFIGYPITPANLLYAYAQQRFPEFYAAPDEITALQWAAGYAAAGKLSVTATSFPGFALMLESLNMAFMMELPMVIVLVQRLGPSTGSATVGAQGDLLLLRGAVSGGYPLPVFCPASFIDAWRLAEAAVQAAVKLRTPVVLLTSKEMMMTQKSIDLTSLPKIAPVHRHLKASPSYLPYQPTDDGVPPFAPVGNRQARVQLNASTHDASGQIRSSTPEALANTRRLSEKISRGMSDYTFFELDEMNDARLLSVSYDVSDAATRAAVRELRRRGLALDHLTIKTLLPVTKPVTAILRRYEAVAVIEENITGALKQVLFGQDERVLAVGRIGAAIAPQQIIDEVQAWRNRF